MSGYATKLLEAPVSSLVKAESTACRRTTEPGLDEAYAHRAWPHSERELGKALLSLLALFDVKYLPLFDCMF